MTPRTLVFDEIDIGIGGRAAEAVGQKLKALTQRPAGAVRYAFAADCGLRGSALLDRQARARGRTKTEVRLLDQIGRVDEVARMLSGREGDGYDACSTRGRC